MTVTVNLVKAEFQLNPPKITFLQGANMDIATIRTNLRAIEESAEGRAQPFSRICKATGNDAFNTAGTVKSSLALTILAPYVVAFEGGATPFITSNGNFIATTVDSPGAIVKINDAVNALVVNGNAITVPTAADNAAAVWAKAIEGALIAEQMQRLLLSVLAGKVSGAGSGTEHFRDMADTKDRVVVTTDPSGNRTAVVRDGA